MKSGDLRLEESATVRLDPNASVRAHAGLPRWETGLQREPRTTEPDAKVLEEIYTHELLWRLPRVEPS